MSFSLDTDEDRYSFGPELTDILSVLIWVQSVCKGYQQMTLADKELPGLKMFSPASIVHINFSLAYLKDFSQNFLFKNATNFPSHHVLIFIFVDRAGCLSTDAYCRSRGREFDPGPVPYFRGDLS